MPCASYSWLWERYALWKVRERGGILARPDAVSHVFRLLLHCYRVISVEEDRACK